MVSSLSDHSPDHELVAQYWYFFRVSVLSSKISHTSQVFLVIDWFSSLAVFTARIQAIPPSNLCMSHHEWTYWYVSSCNPQILIGISKLSVYVTARYTLLLTVASGTEAYKSNISHSMSVSLRVASLETFTRLW